jgi:hypothetical protein
MAEDDNDASLKRDRPEGEEEAAIENETSGARTNRLRSNLHDVLHDLHYFSTTYLQSSCLYYQQNAQQR